MWKGYCYNLYMLYIVVWCVFVINYVLVMFFIYKIIMYNIFIYKNIYIVYLKFVLV